MGRSEDAALVEAAARVASARAAEALAALVGQALTSATHVGPPDPAREERMVHTRFLVQGYPEGDFVAAFPDKSLRVVQEMLAPDMADSAEAKDMVALEVGNICVSQFLGALGDLLHTTLVPSPPELALGVDEGTDPGFLIRTDFRTASGDIFHGTLRFTPPPGLLELLRKPRPSPQ